MKTCRALMTLGVALAVLAGSFVKCDCGPPPEDCLLDPECKDYVEPAVQFDSRPDSVIRTDTVRITWTGNNEQCQYSIVVDGMTATSWSAASSFMGLYDEGEHTVLVRVKYKGGFDIDTQTISFKVAALPDTAAFLKPVATMLGKDSLVKAGVYVKGIAACAVAHLVFRGAALRADSCKPAVAECRILVSDSVLDVFSLKEGLSCISASGQIATVGFRRDSTRDTTSVNLVRCVLKTSVTDTLVAQTSVRNLRGGLFVKQ